MSTTKPQAGRELKASELQSRRSDDFRAIHSNYTQLVENFYDVSIIFSEIMPPDPNVGDKKSYLLQRGSVSMSWEHLQAFADLINKRLKLYEEKIGGKVRRAES